MVTNKAFFVERSQIGLKIYLVQSERIQDLNVGFLFFLSRFLIHVLRGENGLRKNKNKHKKNFAVSCVAHTP